MLSLILLRVFAFLALAAIVFWFAAKVWPKRIAPPAPQPPLSSLTESELRAVKALLEEKKKQLSNLKAIKTINVELKRIDDELAKIAELPGT